MLAFSATKYASDFGSLEQNSVQLADQSGPGNLLYGAKRSLVGRCVHLVNGTIYDNLNGNQKIA